MATIDTYFTSIGIDFNDLVEQIILSINPIYQLEPIVETKNYVVPAKADDDPVEYYRIPLQNMNVINLFGSVQGKSDFANITAITDLQESVEEADVEEFTFGIHGRNFLVNNSDTETILKVRYSHIPIDGQSLYNEIWRALRDMYYYLAISDYGNFYKALDRLSEVKNNLPAKNVHTGKQRRKNQINELKLFRI